MKTQLNPMYRMALAGAVAACLSANVHAQDVQLSQYDAVPVMFNPAHTGMLKYTDLRVSALYRTQWSSLSTSFNTLVLAGDMAIADRFGVGAVFVNSDFANVISATNFVVSGGYQISNPNNSKIQLSTGMQLGVINKRVNTNNLIFDRQFDGSNFDYSLPTFEQFDRLNRFMFDANVGFSFRSTDATKKINPFADMAVFHITMPNESFIGSQKSPLPMRWMGQLGARVEMSQKVVIDPSVIYQRQREAEQFLINTMCLYEIEGTPYQVMGGLGYRTSDAVIIHAGVRHNANIFRISYDVNTSPLSTFSNNRGALEFSAIYRPGRKTRRAIY
jgi:type IX secretion system PorP/SprF family membrane protein